MWFAFPLLLALGFFLPGYFIARALRSSLWAPSAFLISLLVLFHSVFWLGIAGASIVLWTVLIVLIAAAMAAAWLAKERLTALEVQTPGRAEPLDRFVIGSSAVVGAVLLARSAVSPLIGYDTRFRWDFLAQRILARREFDFYPPLTPADFQDYFIVDGIPPLVSFAHWWLYAAAGRHWPALISIFVAAQFACTLAFAYGAASAIFSKRAGFLAAAILAASPLYFHSVVLGQETGLTALGIAATIYFIVSARQPGDLRALTLAGLGAGLCALSREYGWIAVPSGLIAIRWRRLSLRGMFLFVAVAVATGFAWYARNWILTGNPFYPLSFAALPANPVYAGILEHCYAQLGVQSWDRRVWTDVLRLLLLLAPLQLLAGAAGGVLWFRRHGYLLVIAMVLVAVWLYAAGYTHGGFAISMRVLSPALVVLSIPAAGALELLTRRSGLKVAAALALALLHAWTAAHGVFYPVDPKTVPPSQWSRQAFQPIRAGMEFDLRDELARVVRPGTRVLTDNAYLHAALLEKHIEVVPVWSPELRFLFSPRVSVQEIDHRLQLLGIRTVAYYPRSMNTGYLRTNSLFYAMLPQRWRVLGQEASGFFIIYGPPGD